MTSPAGSGPRPVILVVDGDRRTRDRIGDELHRRYAQDYRILTVGSAQTAEGHLERMCDAGDRIALLLTAESLSDAAGQKLLARAQKLHPHAKRALLITWSELGEAPSSAKETPSGRRTIKAEPVRQALALGQADAFVPKPLPSSPDEQFHRIITELLHEWSGADPSTPHEIEVVAPLSSSRGHELRSLLTRNGIPHVFHPSDTPDGNRVLRDIGREASTESIVRLVDGRVLIDPTNEELARAYGALTEADTEKLFDVAIVGAGPAGLSAAVYAASEGLATTVLEREAISGQAGSSSRIRNYLGFVRGLSGGELAQRAYQQAWLFGANFVLMRQVSGLRNDGDVYYLAFADGAEIRARSVILAMGISYLRLGISELERFEGTGVFYGAATAEAPHVAGRRIFVVGGGNSAGQAAAHFARYAERVTLLVRGPALSTMSQYLIDEIRALGIAVRLSTQVVGGGGERRLEWLTLQDKTSGDVDTVPADALFAFIGAQPHTEWLPDGIERDSRGFVVTGSDLSRREAHTERQALAFETSLPGVFAVGDVRAHSVKRVASAVGEGSVAIQQLHQYLAYLKSRSRGPV